MREIRIARFATVGQVIASRSPKFAQGDWVAGAFGWQSLGLSPEGRGIRKVAAGTWTPAAPLHSAGLVPTYCHDTVLSIPPAADDDALVRTIGEAVTAIILHADTRTAPDRAAQVRDRLRAYQGSFVARAAE